MHPRAEHQHMSSLSALRQKERVNDHRTAEAASDDTHESAWKAPHYAPAANLL